MSDDSDDVDDDNVGGDNEHHHGREGTKFDRERDAVEEAAEEVAEQTFAKLESLGEGKDKAAEDDQADDGEVAEPELKKVKKAVGGLDKPLGEKLVRKSGSARRSDTCKLVTPRGPKPLPVAACLSVCAWWQPRVRAMANRAETAAWAPWTGECRSHPAERARLAVGGLGARLQGAVPRV
jgi:hypothetical protein